MINSIIEEYARKLDKPTDEYLNGVFNRLYDLFDYSCLPTRYMITEIDTTKVPKKLGVLCDDTVDIISNFKSVGVRLPDFKYSGYVTAVLMRKYILHQLNIDEHINSMLYIDTDVFMRDLKRFMNKDEFSDVGVMMEYHLQTLFRDIYEADFVFWDKFNIISSNYDLAQLYEILSRRYNYYRGNIFFGVVSNDADYKNIFKHIDTNIQGVMNLDTMYDLSKDKYSIINIGGK